MKRALVILALLATPLAAMAATPKAPKVAVPPAVDKEAAEADEELVKATPPSPTATPEPTPDLSMKGRRSIGLGYGGTNTLSLGWWLSEQSALRLTVGGNYGNETPPTGSGYSSVDDRNAWNASAELAGRFQLASLGSFGFIFDQLGLRYAQYESHDHTWMSLSSYELDRYYDSQTKSLSANLRLGAELFWPGQRVFSLETSYGVGVSQNFSSKSQHDISSDPSGHPAVPDQRADWQSFNVITDTSRWDAAFNVYFR